MKRKIYTLFRAALALCLMLCLTLPVFAGGADPAAGETDESVFAERYVNDAKLVGLFLTEVPDSVRLVLGDRQLRAGDALLREDLLQDIWGYTPDNMPSTRTIDNHIVNLRKKLEDDQTNPKIIVSIRGAGYKFDA